MLRRPSLRSPQTSFRLRSKEFRQTPDNWYNVKRDFIAVIPTQIQNQDVSRSFLDQWFSKTQVPWTPSESTQTIQPHVKSLESNILANEWSDEDRQTIANFFPTLTSDLYEKAKQFQTFYHNEKDFLLDGPPFANEHSMDPERVVQWIESHCTQRQRDIAKELAMNFQYVSWSEFLANVRKVARQVASLLDKREKPTRIVLVVLSMQKSYGVMAALFALALEDFGYFIDAVTNVADSKISRDCTYLWFDDIAFSGSQTLSTFAKYWEHERQAIKPILKQVYSKQAIDSSQPQDGKLPLFTTKAMLARILDAANIQIVIVRAMSAQDALVRFQNIEGFPVFVLPGTFLENPFNVIPNLSQKLRDQDSNQWQPSSTFVYTDYKIPDVSSTFLLPIAGRIPKCPPEATDEEKMEYIRRTENLSTETIDPEDSSQAAGHTQKVLDLIRNCSTTDTTKDIVSNDSLRCPQPQYKLSEFQEKLKSYNLAGGHSKCHSKLRQS